MISSSFRRKLGTDNASALKCMVFRCQSCQTVSHMTCLARHYLAMEHSRTPQVNDSANVMPVAGSCPSCQANAGWSDVLASVMYIEVQPPNMKENGAVRRSPPPSIPYRGGDDRDDDIPPRDILDSLLSPVHKKKRDSDTPIMVEISP